MTEIERLTSEIEKQGWTYSDSLISQRVLEGLSARLESLKAEDALVPAKIGRSIQEQLKKDSRGDLIAWIKDSPELPAEKDFLSALLPLETGLRQKLLLPIQRREFHYAYYPPGARYEKHVDQHRGEESRQISCVLYLNRHWQPSNGGRLRIYQESDADQVATEIDPIFGRMVFFLSAGIAHEVLLAHVPRKSVTGWLRR